MDIVASKGMEKYFHDLIAEADRCYEVAAEARSKGFDPSLEVEIPQADDLASRVEKQLKELKMSNTLIKKVEAAARASGQAIFTELVCATT